MDNKLAYDRPIRIKESEIIPEHKQILQWTGSNKNVLEIACHTGYFSSLLKKNNNNVTGVELYEPALQKARPSLEKSILGDIEKENVWDIIKKDSYDDVLLMHILEHLLKPEEVLLKVKSVLKTDGYIIIALPNVSNWVKRWDMFIGKFEYENTGVMDRTHLRFYNYYTTIRLIENAGFRIEEYSGVSWKVRFMLLNSPIKGL